MIDISLILMGIKSYITFIYGEPIQHRREPVWERLTRFGLLRVEPWFLIGDFNEITKKHEKLGGRLRSSNSFDSFNSMIQNCGML